jgi:NADH:ubiquinone oxidoreductase subunit B-like Fe-S oxidoreductase
MGNLFKAMAPVLVTAGAAMTLPQWAVIAGGTVAAVGVYHIGNRVYNAVKAQPAPAKS